MLNFSSNIYFCFILPLLYPSCRICASSNCSSCSWSSVREWVCVGRTPVCWINCCRLHCLSSLFSSSSSSCLAWDGKEHGSVRKTKDDWELTSVSSDSLNTYILFSCKVGAAYGKGMSWTCLLIWRYNSIVNDNCNNYTPTVEFMNVFIRQDYCILPHYYYCKCQTSDHHERAAESTSLVSSNWWRLLVSPITIITPI